MGPRLQISKKKEKKKKETPEILHTLVERFAQPGASLQMFIQSLFVCLALLFFFHYNKLASLRVSDVSIIFPDHMELFLESSKTDQYRDGAHIVVARTNSQICPVTMLER